MLDREHPINILGSVERDSNFHEVILDAIFAGLQTDKKHIMPRIRAFAGHVANLEVLQAVREVEGVRAVEVDRTVRTALGSQE